MPDPGQPSQTHEAPSSGRPRAAPTARKASSQERALQEGDGSSRPHPPLLVCFTPPMV